MLKKHVVLFVIGLCIFTYILGMFLIPLMDIDAAQYASISREMFARHSFLQVYDLGHDYLDKPPMLFWLSGLSMFIFGVHDWAYRLPSVLFSILAIYATYRLALLYYKKEIAMLSAMVLAASQALFLMNHDVRADTMLMGWVICSIWQLAEWYISQKKIHFILAFIAIAGGMLTKGPIAFFVPVFAFLPHFVLRREWKQLFRWEYIVGLFIIALLLLPMNIGLYRQFDMHPGKIVGGNYSKSGLRFYYWTQSFGRYTGENTNREMNQFTFLLQNMLWSFLPWIIFFLIALVLEIKTLFQQKFTLSHEQEWITTGGFILTYCVLARSQAQLPHYIFVVFPFAAIVTAKFLYALFFEHKWRHLRRILVLLHLFIFTLLWLALIALMAFHFSDIPKIVATLSALCLLLMYSIFYSKKLHFHRVLIVAFFTSIGINIFLNTAFYPALLQYQMGNTAASFINTKHIDKSKVIIAGIHPGYPLYFYGQYIFPDTSINGLKEGEIAITNADSLALIEKKFPDAIVLHKGENFHVTQLNFAFLNPETRSAELQHYAIVDLTSSSKKNIKK